MIKATKIIFLLFLALTLLMPIVSLAEGNPAICDGDNIEDCQKDILGDLGQKTGQIEGDEPAATNQEKIAEVVGGVYGYVLSFFGVVFLGLFIYSGYQWLTSHGNEEKISASRKRMTNAIIGLVIITIAYAGTRFILETLQKNIPQ